MVSVRRAPRRVTSVVSELLRRYRATHGQSVVRRERRHLRRGIYLWRGGTVWTRRGVTPPPQLALSKGLRRPSPAGRWDALIQCVLELITPRFFVVLRGGGSFEVASAASGGEALLIDSGRAVVRRRLVSAVTEEQAALRRQWSASVPAPSHRILEGGHVLEEQYVSGRQLTHLSPACQRRMMRVVFEAYAELARTASSNTSAPVLHELLSPPLLTLLPSPLRQQLVAPADVLRQAVHWPLVPAPADSNWSNVLVTDRDSFVVIDSAPLARLPFFYAPILICARSPAGYNLRSELFTGEFDDSLASLYDAARVPSIARGASVQQLLAISLIVRTAGITTVDGEIDHARYARQLGKRLAVSELSAARDWAVRGEHHA